MKLLRLSILMTVGLMWPAASHAASLYLSPSSGSLTVGKTVSIAVRVNSSGVAINAAEANVSFPSTIFSLSSVSRSSSIFTLWATNPSGSNSAGKVTFSGGLPSPGYTGNAGNVVTMTFVAKAVGAAKLTISGGQVLANDGQGTNVLSSQGTGSYTVTEAPATPPVEPQEPARPTPKLSSSTHPNQGTWSTATSANFTFTKPSGLIGVSYELSQAAGTTPDQVPDAATDTLTIPIPSDGIWYFHIRGQYANGWSNTDHYTIRRDTTPPVEFTIALTRDRGESDPSPKISFSTSDIASGVTRYTMLLNGQDGGDVTSPATLDIATSGQQVVVITAYDAAGNQRTSTLTFTTTGYPAPTIIGLTDHLILLDHLTVRGTAQAADTVVLYVDDQEVSRFSVGDAPSKDDVTVKLPWTRTIDQIFSPGTHNVTAIAVSTEGQTSESTDPRKFTVSGSAITLGGHTLASVALAPLALIGVLVLLAANVLVISNLIWSMRRMHRRDGLVDAELHQLQHQLLRSKLSMRDVEAAIEQIEQDLERPARKRRATKQKRRG